MSTDWAKIYYWYVYKDVNNQWHWDFRAPNHTKVASSGEGYTTKADCEDEIALLQTHGPDAPLGYADPTKTP